MQLSTVPLPAARPALPVAPLAAPRGCRPACDDTQRIVDALALLKDSGIAVRRRIVQAGDTIIAAGDRFTGLTVVNAGIVKLLRIAADGREQVVALKFRGDWLGLDGIAAGTHGCDAVAMDTGEVWQLRYDELLRACVREPRLMGLLHAEMSRVISRDRDARLSLCTLPAEARVIEFLCWWVDSMSRRGLRTDRITLPLSRAEIGNYLGMTLETVSRTLSRLARSGLIGFTGSARRDIEIPDAGRLTSLLENWDTGHTTLQ